MHVFRERESGAEKYESQNDVKMFLIITDNAVLVLDQFIKCLCSTFSSTYPTCKMGVVLCYLVSTRRGFQLSHWLMAQTSIHCLLVSCSYSVRNEGQVQNHFIEIRK